MSAAAMLSDLNAAGIAVALKPDGQLALSGPRAAVAAWIDAIRANKPDLVRLLPKSLEIHYPSDPSDSSVARFSSLRAPSEKHPKPEVSRPLPAEARAACRAWRVTLGNGDEIDVTRCPPATRAEMERDYPGATLEPLPEPDAPPLHPEDERLAGLFLDHIGETDADIRQEYAAALARWPHRLAGLYGECLRLGLAVDEDDDGDPAHG